MFHRTAFYKLSVWPPPNHQTPQRDPIDDSLYTVNDATTPTLMQLTAEDYTGLLVQPLAENLKHYSLARLLSEGTTLKEDKKKRIAVMHLAESGPVFTKTYFASGFLDRTKAKVRGSDARCNHEISTAFARHGLRTPQSLGYLEFRTALHTGSAHFSGFLEKSKTFWQQLQDTPGEQDFWVKAAFQRLAILHNRGFVHGDLKLHNLMIQEQEIYYIDLDSAAQSTTFRARSKDIARFLVGLSEADVALPFVQRGFAEYCHSLNLDHEKVVPHIMRFAGQVQRKHQLKYNRPPRIIL